MQAELSEKKKKILIPTSEKQENSKTTLKKFWTMARSDVVSGFAPYVYTSLCVLYSTCTVPETAPLPGADQYVQQKHFFPH